MMTKTAYYMQMAQEAAAQITGSKEQWTAFLTTSARLYKYPFAEQLICRCRRQSLKLWWCSLRSISRRWWRSFRNGQRLCIPAW